MGEGESSAVRVRIQPLWELQTTPTSDVGVPSPVARERVRVRVVLFQLRLIVTSSAHRENPSGRWFQRHNGNRSKTRADRPCPGGSGPAPTLPASMTGPRYRFSGSTSGAMFSGS